MMNDYSPADHTQNTNIPRKRKHKNKKNSNINTFAAIAEIDEPQPNEEDNIEDLEANFALLEKQCEDAECLNKEIFESLNKIYEFRNYEDYSKANLLKLIEKVSSDHKKAKATKTELDEIKKGFKKADVELNEIKKCYQKAEAENTHLSVQLKEYQEEKGATAYISCIVARLEQHINTQQFNVRKRGKNETLGQYLQRALEDVFANDENMMTKVESNLQKSLDEILIKLTDIKLKKFEVPGYPKLALQINKQENVILSSEELKLSMEATKQEIDNIIAKVKWQIEDGFIEHDEADPACLYDVVINTSTFNKIIHGPGWKVQKNLSRPIVHNGSASVKVNIVGNYNKGKTHTLSFLSGRPLPYGHNVHTKGISCIYPTMEDNLITYLDSAGFDEPAKHVKFLQKLQKKLDKNNEGQEKTPDSEQQKNKEPNDSITQFLKDKQYIEHCIQNFLLETADVFMIVVSQLTNTDQKLIEQITDQHPTKRMYVIHNLYNLRTRADVEKQIKRDIEASFSVDQRVYATSLDQTHNRIFWVDKQNPEFIHVVMAKDDTEAGRYYNTFAKEMMLNSIKDKSPHQKEFKLEENLSQYIKEKIGNYLQVGPEFSTILEECKVDTNSVPPTQQLVTTHHLKRTSQELTSIEFKPASFNQYGYLQMSRAPVLPTNLVYDWYETETELIFKAELPGVTKEEISVLPCTDFEHFNLEINVKRPNNPENDAKYFARGIKTGTIAFQTKSLPANKLIDLGGDTSRCAMTLSNGIVVVRWKKITKNVGALTFSD
jgi:HSP20 family molecular chaperone IbpA